MPRLTVNFYLSDKAIDEEQWAWFDASHTPAVGDFVITPRGNRWRVISVTWQMHHATTLHCNVLVRDVTDDD